jgi:hypothetical protein
MKTIFKIVALAGLLASPSISFSQDNADSTGLPGDHFDLQGAMELFKKASDPESFEKALNTESNHVNNLDLNADKKIDYIEVVDKTEGTSHAVIMRTSVNKTEKQDIAVIVIEKTGDKWAQLQIVGDEDLYGEETVMEPYDEVAEKPTGPAAEPVPMYITVVNVWYWPCVQYMYGPGYVVYYSPWGWNLYPAWWDPWYPYWWYQHYNYVMIYHSYYYHYADYCHLQTAHHLYQGHRSESPTVNNLYHGPRQAYREDVAAGRRPSRVETDPIPQAGRKVGRQVETRQPERTVSPQPRDNNRTIERAPQQRPVARPQQRPVNPPRQVNPQPQRQPTISRPTPQPRPMPAPRSMPVPRGGRR